MSLDILLSIDFFTHPKTIALERSVGAAGVLALQRLWCWAREHRPSGVLHGMDVGHVEQAATRCLLKPPEGFVSALLDVPSGELSGFLDHDEHGNFRLVNWTKRQPWAVDFARAKRARALRALAGKAGGHAADAKRKATGVSLPKDPSTGRFSPWQNPWQNATVTVATPVASPVAPTRRPNDRKSLPSKGSTVANRSLPGSGIRDPEEEEESERTSSILPAEGPRAASKAPEKPASAPPQDRAPAPATADASPQPSEPNRASHGPGKAKPVSDSKPNPTWGTDAHGPKAPGSNGKGAVSSFASEAATLQRIRDDIDAGKPVSDRARRGFTLALPRLTRLRAELKAAHPHLGFQIPPLPEPL